MKYSDQIADWLRELGYTTVFYVGGGGCMHLVESLTRKLKGIATVHEMAAGIAAEYFNVVAAGREKALALVTSGPGLTNIVTAVAGAWYESRELLVIGGQVKTTDLSRGAVRQRGIWEACGAEIVRPITTTSTTLMKPIGPADFAEIIKLGSTGRKGPVFIEIPLDIQASHYDGEARSPDDAIQEASATPVPRDTDFDHTLREMLDCLRHAERPVILLGGGVDRNAAYALADRFAEARIPVMTTFNGTDRIDSRNPAYFGRVNTWGMRYSNLLIQQADCVIALGTRLGLQQTGFNWQEFVPVGKLFQVDIDVCETQKGHPAIHRAVNCDAAYVLDRIYREDLRVNQKWLDFCSRTKQAFPLDEVGLAENPEFICPYRFYIQLSELMTDRDILVPSSSGGNFTVAYQSFLQKQGQHVVSNKGMASMGYGLSGAIGAAVAGMGRRVVACEGDGGFAQNLQELGTVAVNRLNIKMFISDNDGYASIRMTQRNYFGGRYVGCDSATGLGLPNWEKLFAAWDVPTMRLTRDFATDQEFLEAFNSPGPYAFIHPVDPKQLYYPKINSRIDPNGGMSSHPLHEMFPYLDEKARAEFLPYL